MCDRKTDKLGRVEGGGMGVKCGNEHPQTLSVCVFQCYTPENVSPLQLGHI